MTHVYDNILKSVDQVMLENIRHILLRHIGESTVSKEQIAFELFDQPLGKDKIALTPTRDRQIRDAVSDLITLNGEHIVTDTNAGGFHYAKTAAEIDKNIADLRSRIAAMQARIDGLNRARTRVFGSANNGASQPSLLEGGK